ncbi:MAG: M48 family metalloprotease [Candidatus Micrarchaeaceae archaeon]
MAKGEKKNFFGVEVYIEPKDKYELYTKLSGKIIISTKAVNSLSEQCLKTLIMHERFHQRLNKTKSGCGINLIAGALMILALLGMAFELIYLIASPALLFRASGGPIGFALQFLFLMAILVITIYYRRLQEKAADLYSAEEVGKRAFVAGFKEMREKFPRKERLIDMIRHPFYFATHGKLEDRIKFIEEL